MLAPAIRYAESGFPVTEIFASYWEASDELRRDDQAAKLYLPNGRGPRTGEMFSNPELAWEYRQIASGGGRKAFYEGEIAKRLARLGRGMGRVDGGRSVKILQRMG